MTRFYFFKNIVVTLLTLLFLLGLATWTLAQGDDELAVAITEVDSQTFPQVTAHVTVSDVDGWLLSDLTAANFQMLEDNTQVSVSSVAVELDDDSSNESIVLALDVSMPGETLNMIREDVKSFVGALGPQDQVAIVTFSNEVQTAQEFSTDKEALWAALDALEPGGSLTALNKAVFEAATMVGALVADRRMVIVLTDSKDNVGWNNPQATLSSTDAVSRAIEYEVPVYIIGFGDKVESDTLADMAEQTGGQARIFSDPDGVRAGLQTMGGLFQSEGIPHLDYRVTFQSELGADDAGHDLSIGVIHKGKAGQSQARFVAVSGQVIVTLPDIVDGQTVGGVVSLVADVAAPASIASVEYLLDGKLLTKQYAPTTTTRDSFSFDWDSTTVEPGVYTLTVGSIDSAGNAGYAQARLNVALPVAVSVSTSQQEIELGNEVIIEAQVDTLADIARVEFLLDGQSLGVVNNPPFHFSFDSGDYAAGEHTIAVYVQDSLGRENSDSLSMQFLASPEEPPLEPGWIRYIKLVFMGMVIAIIVFVGIIVAIRSSTAVSKWVKKKHQTICHVEIKNLGNVPSQYQLLAKDPSGTLALEFILNGVNLEQQQTTQIIAGSAKEPGTSKKGVTRATRTDQFDSLKEKTQQAKGTSQAIMCVLVAVESLLPHSVGTPLRNLISRLRQQQAAVRRVEQAPRRVSGNIKRVRSQASRVKPSSASTRTTPSSSQIAEYEKAPIAQTVVDTWGQTPLVEPGETLLIDLLVDSIIRPRQTQQCPITVISQSVEQADAPVMVQEGNVQIEVVSWFQRLLPFLVFATVITIQVLLIGFLLRITGVLG